MSRDTYRAACLECCLPPPVGMPYLGFEPRHPPIAGVHDPLFVCAAGIEANGEQVVILTVDTIGLADTILGPGRSFIGEVKNEIQRRSGIPPSHILIASTHIHSSPETIGFRPLTATYPEAVAWLEKLQRTLVSYAVEASEHLPEVQLKIGKGRASGLTVNRRGDDCLDEEVAVLMLSSWDHGVAMVSFACHPVIMQVQDQASADYVGAMRDAVGASPDSVGWTLFLLGACADINPKVGNTKRFEDAQQMGETLAAEVTRLLSRMAEHRYPIQPAIVKAASAQVEFPSRPLPHEHQVRRLETPYLIEEARARLAEGRGPFVGEVQVIRIGDALLIAMPGEVFCATGRELKRRYAPLMVVPVTCANGYLGYLAPPEIWNAGGYEVRVGPQSKVGPEATGIMMQTIEKLVSTVMG